jgi:bifunctional ADP-heptose synthase (sugar kinase/adenylyltransferase)
LHEFVGVTCATPNETEIEPLVGQALESRESVEAAGLELQRRLEARTLIVTRGRLGMSVFANGTARHLAAYGGDAVDVAGAGDTVAATVSLALAAGAAVQDAARLANYAASRVVLERGTAVTDVDAVRRCLEADRSA